MIQADLQQISRRAYELGMRDAQRDDTFEHGLVQHVWGQVIPDFTLDERAVVLKAYGDGWCATGKDLPEGNPLPSDDTPSLDQLK